jgi:Fic family protein
LLDRALISLGRLDSVSTLLPDTHLFFEREEAPGVPLDDVREVSNYVAALNHGLKRLKENIPLSQKQILII